MGKTNNLKHSKQRKEQTNMPNQTEIKNTIDAPRILGDAIEDFKKKRAEVETELTQSLAKDLSTAPLNVDRAIEKYKAWKAKDEALAAKIKTAEEFQLILSGMHLRQPA
jgi:hypothetical protein